MDYSQVAPTLPDAKDNESFELTTSAFNYLLAIADMPSWNESHVAGQLTKTEVETIFEVCPQGTSPFGLINELPPNTHLVSSTNDGDWTITKEGWMALWRYVKCSLNLQLVLTHCICSMLALTNPAKCVEYLYYIGYSDLCLYRTQGKDGRKLLSVDLCLNKCRPRKPLKRNDRKVYQVFIFGEPGCGKVNPRLLDALYGWYCNNV